jgi:hypothetical protein
VFALVALDALDDDFGRCAFLALSRFGRFGFGGFLLGVFFSAFLGVDGEGGEVLRERFRGVEGGVEGGVGFREPFGALFGTGGYGAAWDRMLAARSRTYFWGKRADAAVDYGLGRAGVRGICCFGHD